MLAKVTPINADLMDDTDIEDVAEAIQGAISTYPGRLQILIQSEKINLEKNIEHIQNREEELDTEIKVELLEEQKKYLLSLEAQIKNVLNFYIVLECKAKDWNQANQIHEDYFNSMKNELEAQEMYMTRLDTLDIKKLLYERFNPESSQNQLIQEDWEIDELMPANAQRCVDGRHLEIENLYYRHYAITSYPQEVSAYRWLKKLFSFNERVSISITMTPKNKVSINRELSKAISELGRKRNEAKEEYLRQSYERQIESARQMISEMGSDNIHLYDTNVTIGVGAKSFDDLNRVANNLISKISSSYCQATELKFKDFDPFFATLPILAENKITQDFVWNLSSKDIASIIPFDSSELMEETGTMIGENMVSHGLVIIDQYNRIYNNPHMCIIADSGSGKSFFLGCHLIREAPYRDYIIQFDIDGTAIFPWAHKYRFSPTSGIVTNPFHIRNTTLSSEEQNQGNEVGSYLAIKVMDLMVFFRWVIPEMKTYDEALLEESIRITYQKVGLTPESTTLPDRFPIISDLVDTLTEKMNQADSEKEKESYNNIIISLKPYHTGSYATMLNGQTNWDYQFHTILDISALPEAIQKPLYDLLLKDTWQFVKKDGTLDKMEVKVTKKIVIDEAHVLADPENPQALKFISTELIKQSRKFGVSVVTATQNIKDFTSIEKYGQAIIDNSFFKIFFRLGETDHALAKGLYGFSEKEMKVIKGKTSKGVKGTAKGKGIFIAGSQRVLIQSKASKFELEIMDPAQYKEIYGVASRFIPNKEEEDIA